MAKSLDNSNKIILENYKGEIYNIEIFQEGTSFRGTLDKVIKEAISRNYFFVEERIFNSISYSPKKNELITCLQLLSPAGNDEASLAIITLKEINPEGLKIYNLFEQNSYKFLE